MSRKLTSMRKVKEVYRLYYEMGLSPRKIAASLKMGRTTVRDYISRAEKAGLITEEIKFFTEEKLKTALFLLPAKKSDYPKPE